MGEMTQFLTLGPSLEIVLPMDFLGIPMDSLGIPMDSDSGKLKLHRTLS